MRQDSVTIASTSKGMLRDYKVTRKIAFQEPARFICGSMATAGILEVCKVNANSGRHMHSMN